MYLELTILDGKKAEEAAEDIRAIVTKGSVGSPGEDSGSQERHVSSSCVAVKRTLTAAGD